MALLVFHLMPSRQHALVQNPRDDNPFNTFPVEHDMAAVLYPPQARINLIATASEPRILL
jgi:hypothetical protein